MLADGHEYAHKLDNTPKKPLIGNTNIAPNVRSSSWWSTMRRPLQITIAKIRPTDAHVTVLATFDYCHAAQTNINS